MAKLTERQLERRYCALERKRDAVAAMARDGKHGAGSRIALGRAADALTAALNEIQAEGRDIAMPR